MNELDSHEYANLFPLIAGDAYDRLVNNIKENGQQEPITLYQGKILDGRNRYNACKKIGIDYNYIEYTGDDPLGYVISLNLHRRHLNESQRAMVAARLMNMEAGDNQHTKEDAQICTTSRAEAAEMLNVSERSVSTAKKAQKELPKEVVDQIDAGEVTVSKAVTLEKKKTHIADIEQQEDDILEMKLPAIENKYHVISIDPPWPYEDGKKNTYDPLARRVANPYPEMSIQQISELDIPAADDSVIWLWTTHRFLPDAFSLLKQWGFDYKATMVWDKQSIGMGHWLRMQCEFCLLGVKGNPFWENTTVRDLISSKRREHSRKPDEFFDLVDSICIGAKLEYFSREKREGWAQIGNETDKFES